MRVLDVTRWPGLLVFMLAGLSAVAFAFISVNLFAQAMANLDFIQRHGLLALREGGLLQLAELLFWGVLALCAYLGFKISEVELVFRYFNRAQRVGNGEKGRRELRARRRETDRD